MKFVDTLLGKKTKGNVKADAAEYPAIMKTYFRDVSGIISVPIDSTSDLLQYLEGIAKGKIDEAVDTFEKYCDLSDKLNKAEMNEEYRIVKIKYDRTVKITQGIRKNIESGELENTEGRQERLSEADKEIDELYKQITTYETQIIAPIKSEFNASTGVNDAITYLNTLEQINKLTTTKYFEVCRADLKKADMDRLPSELKSISSKLNAYWNKYLESKIRAERLMSIEKKREEMLAAE